MAIQSSTVRRFLYGFIASLSACAAVGIYILALGNSGRLEENVLSSTAIVACGFLLGLFASVPTARHAWHPIGPTTLIFLPIPIGLSMFVIWWPYFTGGYSWELLRQIGDFLFSSWVIAVALSLTGLLSLARLKASLQWVRIVTVAGGNIFAALLVVSVFGEIYGDAWGRILGILGILTTLGCLTVPILHRVSAIPLEDRVHTAKMEINLTCPRCAKAQVLLAGGANCVECKLRINIDIEEEQCPKCGYPLYKIDSAQCPECGTPIARPTSGNLETGLIA